MHDTYRVNKGGVGSFDQVMAGLTLLKKHEVDFNILCTVHAANQDYPLEVYRFFRDELETEFIQFIPIIERATRQLLPLADDGWSERPDGDRPLYIQDGHLVTERSVEVKQYGRFLIEIFEEWVQHDVGSVYVQIFDVILGSWVGQHNLCIFSPTGYKQFFNHVNKPMRIMAGLLRQQRAPAEIMQLYAAEDTERDSRSFVNVGRNDPCPCGSGKIFKKCHGRQKDS